MSTIESEASGRSRVEEDAGERERERERERRDSCRRRFGFCLLEISANGRRAGPALEDL